MPDEKRDKNKPLHPSNPQLVYKFQIQILASGIEELFFFNFPPLCILVLNTHVNVMLSLKQMLFRIHALIHFIEALWR